MTMPIFDHTHPKIIERTFSFREFAPACKKSALREKCWNTKFFLVRIFPHSDWMRRDTLSECGKRQTRKNSVFGHFSRSAVHSICSFLRQNFRTPWLYWPSPRLIMSNPKICWSTFSLCEFVSTCKKIRLFH